ncbi:MULTISPECIES: NAD(P)/FAD-dependent oxidoreductase [Asticcacaulis]|uniref:flavin-containing monooxygenase n=1 Tax=Asticcacaulis TaxID=76890 RepID=UPI001AE907F6|nr:NAD(P)/FAD-dependent oxidoreductase [Asticcacaulis sp. BE141]MBP2160473.1 putative flavoprotein involved in K+ transport [Asticcacaulis solisilvae]MDR6801518.1 putative flavoprotein involved in K+ transport [Asticcacaulis sp. BE141]
MAERSSPETSPTVFDAVILGAGQTGLAAGYYLKTTGLTFRIVEGGKRVGDVWRNRYDSLRLFTPREFSALPGLPLAGDPKGRPDRIEFADYLETYAKTFELPIDLERKINRVKQRQDGTFELSITNRGPILARNVVLAFGAYPGARQPPERKDLSPKIHQTDASAYRNPQQLPAGPVLIIGDGAAGRDFAAELAGTHEVHLATGRPRIQFPDPIFGKSVFWWFRLLGFFNPKSGAKLSRFPMPLPETAPSHAELKEKGVRLYPRFVKARGSQVWFEDGSSVSPRTVIWAIGHTVDTSLIDIRTAKTPEGRLSILPKGLSPVPGLYYLGRPFQSSMASALIVGAGPDAKYVVEHLSERLAATGPSVAA